jgi:hypothetical protein
MLIVERRGLEFGFLTTCIGLAWVIGGWLARYGASAVLHRVAFMLGEEGWIRRGHRQREEEAGDSRNSADYEFHTPTPLIRVIGNNPFVISKSSQVRES